MEGNIVIFILGPTASGKTGTAIALARLMAPAQIVSADSIQVYRGLDIGSAKPDTAARGGIPHHLIDVAEPGDPGFSVARYRELALAAIARIHAEGGRAIVAGGSGLYVDALTRPLSLAPAGDKQLREQLAREEQEDPGSAYRRLREADPATAGRLHENDKKRILRAMEVYLSTGKPLSAYGGDFRNAQGEAPPWPVALFGLMMDRKRLYERIDRRVDEMFRRGLAQEADRLLAAGLDPSLPALQGLGYKQLIEARLTGESMESAAERIKRDTRRFAKRQMTWFRRDGRIRWLDMDVLETPEAAAREILEQLKRDENNEGL